MFALFGNKKGKGKGKTDGNTNMIGKGMGRMMHSLLYTDRGRFIVSLILGLGLASIFRKFCEGKNCYSFIGPEHKKIVDEIYSYDSEKTKCYTFKEKSVKCDPNKKIMDFA